MKYSYCFCAIVSTLQRYRFLDLQKMFREIGSVDVDAEEFKSLPSEIQHEILMEMKDSYRRRYNRRKTQEMPDVCLITSDSSYMTY